MFFRFAGDGGIALPDQAIARHLMSCILQGSLYARAIPARRYSHGGEDGRSAFPATRRVRQSN